MQKYYNMVPRFSLEEEKEEEAPATQKNIGGKFRTGLNSVEDNHVYFYDEFCQESVLEFYKNIKEAEKFLHSFKTSTIMSGIMGEEEINKHLNIYIHINSGGGSLTDGLLSYDITSSAKFNTVTIVEGMAASAAALLSLAGNKRCITPNSYILVHQLSTFVAGTFENIKDKFKNSEGFMDRICKLYLSKTKFSESEFKELIKHDLFLSANEAFEKGLVDCIEMGRF